ncbi:MAG TPA: hypothetical protein VLM75_10425 [Spirochaetota bacterium]|nr:hypothetical protein [Spirochaetota bacterium]
MSMHSAAGRRLGLTDAQIEDLLTLDPRKFDHREWLALRYAQDRAFLDGAEPAGNYVREYRRHYTEAERARISKLITAMQFANYWNNTFRRRPWNKSREGSAISCRTKAQPRS